MPTSRNPLRPGGRSPSAWRRLCYLCAWRGQSTVHPVAALFWVFALVCTVVTPALFLVRSPSWGYAAALAGLLWLNVIAGAVCRLVCENIGVDDPESIEVCQDELDELDAIEKHFKAAESAPVQSTPKPPTVAEPVSTPSESDLAAVMPTRRGL